MNLVCVRKCWRILQLQQFDPFDFENCNNLDMLKPLSVRYDWISDQDYAAYNTDERVDRLRSDDILPDDQILINQGVHTNDLDMTTHLKKRFRRRK